MELDGLTGKMRFDNVTGNRNYFKVDVIRVHESRKHHLGSWDPVDRMTLTRSALEMYSEFTQSISNKTFVVVGKLVSTLHMSVVRIVRVIRLSTFESTAKLAGARCTVLRS